jgi:hypothetical protein
MATEEHLDPQAAAELLRRTTDHTIASFDVRTEVMYACWGLTWLVGLGVMWLSVRNQQPYHGPSAASYGCLGVLIAVSVAVTGWLARATRGIEGPSAVQGRMFGAAWPIGFAAFFALQAALAAHNASPVVLGIVGSAIPFLVTGTIYLMGAAIWQDRPMFALGVWLIGTAAVGAWTGPVGILLVEALAGGGASLALAGYLARRRRP